MYRQAIVSKTSVDKNEYSVAGGEILRFRHEI